MNEGIWTHWGIAPGLVACGYDGASGWNVNPDGQFVTCPKCRKEIATMVARLTATEPTKGKRK